MNRGEVDERDERRLRVRNLREPFSSQTACGVPARCLRRAWPTGNFQQPRSS